MILLLLVLLLVLKHHRSAQGDVYVSLRGINYSNNSLVTLTEIGDNMTTALICHTNITSCCKSLSSSALSNWKYPGRTIVKSRYENETFTRNRGKRTIFLYRKEDRLGPTGMYTCEVNDALTNTTSELHVGIFLINEGRPSIVSLTYEPSTGILVCLSTGGPASQVKWNRKGAQYQESQQMINGSSATYHNLLSINSFNLADYNGTFNCTVSNVRGTETTATTYKSIELFIKQGLMVEIICYSNLTVQTIKLFNESSGQVLMSVSNKRLLIFQIEDIEIDFNNTGISCEVEILLPGNRTVKEKISFTSQSVPPQQKRKIETNCMSLVIGLTVCLIVLLLVITVLGLIIFILVKKRNRVHQDTPSPLSSKVSKPMKLDTKSTDDCDKAENISYEYNTSYGLVAREKDSRAAESIMYEAIEDLPSKNTS